MIRYTCCLTVITIFFLVLCQIRILG
jgi:hypothetical protein